MEYPSCKGCRFTEPDFLRFAERHGLTPGNPETRKEYDQWLTEQMFLTCEFARRKDEGKAEGIAKGEAKRAAKVALKAFQAAALSGEDFSIVDQRLSDYGIEPDIVRTARAEAESQRPRGKKRR